MSKYVPTALGIALILVASTALAEERREDPLKSYATPFARSGSAFRPKKLEPLEKYTALECVPVEATEDTDRRDRIYKIFVNISFDDNWQPEDMNVLHYAVSGAAYNRSDQYTQSNLTRTPGKTDYYWTGTWDKNSAVIYDGASYAVDRKQMDLL
jgi:hypothetical protein